MLVDQQNLKRKQLFFKHLAISVSALVGGILYFYFSKTADKGIVYFISQMPIIFLILYSLIRIPYYKMYRTEPEILRQPEKNRDIIPSLLVMAGCATFPFLIDLYIFKNVFS
jgi:hypothetical protein